MPLNAHVEMIPGPLDRPDPIARAVRWWLSALPRLKVRSKVERLAADALSGPSRIAPARPIVALNERDCFIADITLPPGTPEAHKPAITLRLKELAPIDPAKLSIAAIATRRSDAGVTYGIAMAREARLQGLVEQARKAGAQILHFTPNDAVDITLRTNAQIKARRLSAVIDGVLGVALVLATSFLTHLQTERIRVEAEEIALREREVRRQVVDLEQQRKDAELAQDLSAAGIISRRPGAALDALANINAATPDIAWWTSIRWSPEETILTAKGRDATEALRLLSQDALRWSVELAGPITTSQANETQNFEARFTLKNQERQ